MCIKWCQVTSDLWWPQQEALRAIEKQRWSPLQCLPLHIFPWTYPFHILTRLSTQDLTSSGYSRLPKSHNLGHSKINAVEVPGPLAWSSLVVLPLSHICRAPDFHQLWLTCGHVSYSRSRWVIAATAHLLVSRKDRILCMAAAASLKRCPSATGGIPQLLWHQLLQHSRRQKSLLENMNTSIEVWRQTAAQRESQSPAGKMLTQCLSVWERKNYGLNKKLYYGYVRSKLTTPRQMEAEGIRNLRERGTFQKREPQNTALVIPVLFLFKYGSPQYNFGIQQGTLFGYFY